MTSDYYYNYAVVDSKYPGEPRYWSLSGFGFGDAASVGWSFEFIPESTKTTELLISNLKWKSGTITIAIPTSAAPTKEPKWGVGISYDQLLIMQESDAPKGRKFGLYKVRVLKVTKETDSPRHRVFKHPVKILLCQVGAGGYVAGSE